MISLYKKLSGVGTGWVLQGLVPPLNYGENSSLVHASSYYCYWCTPPPYKTSSYAYEIYMFNSNLPLIDSIVPGKLVLKIERFFSPLFPVSSVRFRLVTLHCKPRLPKFIVYTS